jgi:hypothetical protein
MQSVTCAGRLAVVCLFLTTSVTAAGNALRYVGGVRNGFDKKALNEKQRQAMLKSLRAHTGWQQLDFDENGFLACPQHNAFNGGSAAARKLLGAALSSAFAFELESHDNVKAVAFARLAEAVHYESRASGATIEVFPLQLDFADFNKLRGDAATLAAFDLGIVVLHELAHAVWQLKDARARDEEPGECEDYINEIRRELGMPERQTYFARLRTNSTGYMGGNYRLAELIFARRQVTPGKVKADYGYLQWDAQAVGNLLPYAIPQRAPAPLLTAR